MTKKKNKKEQGEPKPKRPVYLDQYGNPIPFLNQKEKDKPQKQEYKFGIFSLLGFVAAIILLASLTPFYSVLMLVTPTSIQEKILWPLHRNVTLYAQSTKFDKPVKVPIPEPGTLPVLGFDTGICFSFYSTQSAPDQKYIDAERLTGAVHGKNIAEIIAIGTQGKYEYHLKSITYSETIDNDGRIMSVICQKLGRAYAPTPKNIRALYIRPLEPFVAEKAIWNSTKHLYDDYSSPLEPEKTQMP